MLIRSMVPRAAFRGIEGTKAAPFPSDHQLAVWGLGLTLILGVLAIVVAVRADHRASLSAELGRKQLEKLEGAVDNVKLVNSALASSTRTLLQSVGAIESAIGELRGEAMGLIGESYVRLLDAALSREDSSMGRSVPAQSAVWPTSDIFVQKSGGEGELRKISVPSEDDVLRVLESIDPLGGGVQALDLFEKFEPGETAYYTVKRLYELRSNGSVTWQDAVLNPTTVVHSRP